MEIRIKEVAADKGWSVYALARNMGLPPQTVYSWANGRTQPSYANMDALCTLLECDMSDLFCYERVDLNTFRQRAIDRQGRALGEMLKQLKEERYSISVSV